MDCRPRAIDSEECLRALTEAHPLTALVLDEAGRCIDVLGSQRLVAGHQLKGRAIGEVLPKNQADQILAAVAQTIRTASPQPIECELRTPNGTCWFEGGTALVRTSDVSERLVVCVLRDMTARWTKDRALLKSEARFRHIFEASALGMCLVDSDLKVHVANARVCAILAYEACELMGKSLRDLSSAEDARALSVLAEALFRDQTRQFQIEERLARRDGEHVWVSITGSLLRNPETAGSIALVTLQDITFRKAAEAQVHELTRELEQRVEQRTSQLELANLELERARDAAEQLSQAKSLFLANVSHELRTPLNAILGYAQLLQGSPDITPPLREYAGAIGRSGEHLLNIIEDVLDMSKIEAGHVSLNVQEFSLEEMLDDLERMFRMRAEARGLTLSVEMAANLPRFVTTDEGKLRQILVNLLSNAVKFTHRGGVTVRVFAAVSDRRGAPLIAIDVEDTGVGIPEDEAGFVFAPFEQTSAGRAQQGGTGLGLAISKEFAETMGGSLAFTSRAGEGTTFHLRIPIPSGYQATPRQRPVALTASDVGMRVLVVDGIAKNRALQRSLLSSVGFEVDEAATIDQAMQLVVTRKPRVAVVELRLPPDSHVESLRPLRLADPNLALLAVSAGSPHQDRAAATAAGCDAYLRKPLRDDELLEVVGRLAQARFQYSSPPSPASEIPIIELSGPGGSRIASLSSQLRADMKEATVNGDLDQLMCLIEDAKHVDREIAEHLQSLAMSYQYEKLDELLTLDE